MIFCMVPSNCYHKTYYIGHTFKIMRRRKLALATVSILGGAGCLGRSPDMSNESDKEEFQDIPESCSPEDQFFIAVNNQQDQSHQVSISMFDDGSEILYQEISLTQDSHSTSSDAEDIRAAGCYGNSYSIEVNVSGREPVEREFTAKSSGFLAVNIHSDRVSIIFSTAD